MRRLLVLIMLCLIPLQLTWAVMTEYHGHQQETVAQHFGHHDENHQAALDSASADKQPATSSDLGHDHCHLWGFLGMLSACTLGFHDFSQPLLRGDDASYLSVISDQPERPSWFTPV